MKFIGDIHADWKWYNQITEKLTDTIQVGDFGCGFEKYSTEQLNINSMIENNHQVIRGNHDNPEIIKTLPTYIQDGTFDKSGEVFCIGGAQSIDRGYRIEGVSWWPDEELTQDRFYQIMDFYEKSEPEIVATHDCPFDIYKILYGESSRPSITSQALSSIFYIHKPKYWIFGHHHITFSEIIDGTRFICCPINTVITI